MTQPAMKPSTPLHNAIKGKKGFVSFPLNERLSRFTGAVDINGCTEWLGSKNEHGYGQLWDGKKNRSAHVVAYELASGISAIGKIVGHWCENRACVNPKHLALVSASENQRWHRQRTLKLLDEKRQLVAALRECIKGMPHNPPQDAAVALMRSLGEAQ